MYCLFCDTSLSEEALFCFKCGKLTTKGNGESGESEHTPTFTFISSPPDPYHPRPSTSYGPPPFTGGMHDPPYAPQNPYIPLAPPPPYSPSFLKGLFMSALVVLLLSSGLGTLLLLKPGVRFLTTTPQRTVQSTNPTVTATATLQVTNTAQVSVIAQNASTLYTADWSSGLKGWYEFSIFQDWSVDGGILRDDGTNTGAAAPGIEAPYEVTSTSDYAVETEIQVVKAGQPCFDITTIRTNAQWSGYKAVVCLGKVTISKVITSPRPVALTSIAFDPNTTWHTYRLEAKGITLRLLIDGHQMLQVQDTTYLSGGKLGLNSFQTQLKVKSYKVFAL